MRRAVVDTHLISFVSFIMGVESAMGIRKRFEAESRREREREGKFSRALNFASNFGISFLVIAFFAVC